MKKKIKWTYLLPLLSLGLFTQMAPLEAREASVKELVNSSQSFFNPFSFFDEAMSSSSFTNLGGSSGLTMYEEADRLVVEANLPGLSADDIEITYDRGSLQIRGKRAQGEENDERNYYHKSLNSFAYNIEIPHSVDESKNPIAEFKNGQMTITFEKSESAKPKKIEIQSK